MNKKRNGGAALCNPVIKEENGGKEKLDYDLKIHDFPWSKRQQAFIELVESKDAKIVFVKGPAGTAKTLLAAYAGLKSLDQHKTSEIIYLRQAVESSSFNLGFLKGSFQEKMGPYTQPLNDKLEELLPSSQAKRLLDEDRIKSIPIGFLRGLSFNNSFIILDEAQNLPFQDFLTVLTRLGQYSKAIVCGDIMQSDIKISGFNKIYNGFDSEEAREKGIYCFEFGPEDIFRNAVLSYIIETIEKIRKT